MPRPAALLARLSFKIANALIGLSLGSVGSVDERIPCTGDANPFMREWLEPMGLRGAMRVSNVPLYQELACRIGLQRMRKAIRAARLWQRADRH